MTSRGSVDASANVISPAERTRRVRRGVALGTAVITTTLMIGYAMLIGVAGVNTWEWISVVPMSMLMFWISFSFSMATAGFIRLRGERERERESIERDPARLESTRFDSNVETSTAVLMPVYNESPMRVMAGVEAMIDSLRDAQSLSGFEFYVLSDSTRYDVWLREEWHWNELKKRHPDANIHYRHRGRNTARKAGNIADFCVRWGGNHDFMIVLDADSLMSGETMIEMVARMRRDDQLGILQVPPRPIGRWSLLARLQQFSAAVYGPMFVEGFAAWSDDQGNYWGHNAIIRIAAFGKHCELPVLPGRKPLGGEILSHDFVEAALMVRGGYRVRLASDLGGSYEECPTTITDYAIRDNRWCQGNLQHFRLMIAEGFNGFSRMHFGSGLMAYLSSPIWLLFIVLSMASLIWDAYHASTVDTKTWIAAILFAASMLLLLSPKIMAASLHRYRSDANGGPRKWSSVAIEVVCSILLSPIMAIYHTRFVINTLLGRSVRWNAQQRDERGVRLSEAVSDYAGVTVLGVVATVAMGWFSPMLLIWFSPLLVGLLASIPIAVAMGSPALGRRLRHAGLLVIDEEISPPLVQVAMERNLAAIEANREPEDLFERVIRDPQVFSLHAGVQRATHADIAMSMGESKAIEAVVSAGGPSRIPEELRCSVLLDTRTLKQLHIDSCVANWNRPVESSGAVASGDA